MDRSTRADRSRGVRREGCDAADRGRTGASWDGTSSRPRRPFSNGERRSGRSGEDWRAARRKTREPCGKMCEPRGYLGREAKRRKRARAPRRIRRPKSHGASTDPFLTSCVLSYDDVLHHHRDEDARPRRHRFESSHLTRTSREAPTSSPKIPSTVTSASRPATTSREPPRPRLPRRATKRDEADPKSPKHRREMRRVRPRDDPSPSPSGDAPANRPTRIEARARRRRPPRVGDHCVAIDSHQPERARVADHSPRIRIHPRMRRRRFRFRFRFRFRLRSAGRISAGRTPGCAPTPGTSAPRQIRETTPSTTEAVVAFHGVALALALATSDAARGRGVRLRDRRLLGRLAPGTIARRKTPPTTLRRVMIATAETRETRKGSPPRKSSPPRDCSPPRGGSPRFRDGRPPRLRLGVVLDPSRTTRPPPPR